MTTVQKTHAKRVITQTIKLNELFIALPYADISIMTAVNDLQLALKDYKKSLVRDEPYSKEKMDELCQQIYRLRDPLVNASSAMPSIQHVIERYAKLNGGKSPIKSIDINIEFDEDFKNKMSEIASQLKEVEKQLGELKGSKKSDAYGPLLVFMNLSDSLTKSMKSLLSSTIQLCDNPNYLGEKVTQTLGLNHDGAKRPEAVGFMHQKPVTEIQVPDTSKADKTAQKSLTPRKP